MAGLAGRAAGGAAGRAAGGTGQGRRAGRRGPGRRGASPGWARGRGSPERGRGRAGSGAASGLQSAPARSVASREPAPGRRPHLAAGCRAAREVGRRLLSPVAAANLLREEITLTPAENSPLKNEGKEAKQPNSANVRRGEVGGAGVRSASPRAAAAGRGRKEASAPEPGLGCPSRRRVCWACWKLDKRIKRHVVFNKLFYLKPSLFSFSLFFFFFYFLRIEKGWHFSPSSVVLHPICAQVWFV